MKKRVAGTAIIGIAITLAVIVGYYEGTKEQAIVVMGKQQDLTEINKGQQSDTQQSKKKGKVTNSKPIADLDDAYEAILNNCSREFIGGYLVDESFLHWIYAQYGKNTIISLAQAVSGGNQDVNQWYQMTGKSIHVLWLLYCQKTGIEQYDLDNVIWKNAANANQVVMDFTGDINFADDWCTTEYMDAQPNGIADCFSPDLLKEMQSADIMMLNNEFTYTTRGTALVGKDYTFRAKPDRVKLLETFGTDIVNLANNHVYDYGDVGLLDTLDTLKKEGIPYVGAGANLNEAEKPVFFIENGRKIAIVSATQIERSLNFTKEATDSSPGVLKTLDPDKFVAEIKSAKQESDAVIVFVHWGTEGSTHYGSDQISLAKAYVEAGADAIIGGHTHCLQGISYINGVPVIYSLGNFWFSQETLDTGMAQVILNQDGSIRFRFLPCIQKNMVTSLVTDPSEKDRIFDYLQGVSDKVSIDGDGNVSNLAK
jgi:poly-gamma-glutamate synthesis protein (capsule biosynthesis protein)